MLHGRFLRSAMFWRKTAQFYATQRESGMGQTPSIGNGTQTGKNERKNHFLNHESPSLTAELQARLAVH